MEDSVYVFQMFVFFFLQMHGKIEDETETSNKTVTCKREGED